MDKIINNAIDDSKILDNIQNNLNVYVKNNYNKQTANISNQQK